MPRVRVPRVGSVAAEFRPDGTTLADCAGEFRCYEQAFANVAFREGPKSALALLEKRSAKPGPIESDCHRIVHAIGAGALAHFDGDPGKALAAGSVQCASGYYHGILERSLLGKPEEAIAPIAQRICSDPDIRRTDFIHFQCVHGLGHGLMIYTGYDLPRSLDYCEPLETEWERESCRGGVFMENSQSSYGVRSRWLKDDDLLYPCDWVAEKHKYQCYLIQLARIGPALGFDWAKVSDTCREADEDYVDVCFQSMGREISGQVRHDAASILAACQVTERHGARVHLRRCPRRDVQRCGVGALQGALRHRARPPSARTAGTGSERSSAASTRLRSRSRRRARRRRSGTTPRVRAARTSDTAQPADTSKARRAPSGVTLWTSPWG